MKTLPISTYRSTVHTILDGPEPLLQMENFIMQLSQKGHSKKEIYTLLLSIHAEMEDGEPYDRLGDTLDRLGGWWSGNEILPNEKI